MSAVADLSAQLATALDVETFDPRPYPVRASQLVEMRRSPAHYRQSVKARAMQTRGTAATEVGTGMHGLLFGNVDVIGVECESRAAKAFRDAVANNIGVVLPKPDYLLAQRMAAAIRRLPEFAEVLADPLACIETPVTWEWMGKTCVGTPDLVCNGVIYDPKSTASDLETFARVDVFKYRYLEKMAFYRRMMRTITGADFDCALVVVEKSEPHAAQVVPLDSALLDVADARNEAWMRRVVECERTGEWSGPAPIFINPGEWWFREVA